MPKMYMILTIGAMIILTGCQGQPRYGGGLHTREGDAQAERQTQPTGQYAVDPISLGQVIDRFLGRPYAGQGQGQKGYDCSEFVGAVYQEYSSIHLPRTTDKLWKTGRKIERGTLFFGDLVFFDTGGRGISHVGIYVGFNEFVHSSTSNGIIISNLNETYYHKRYRGARRVME